MHRDIALLLLILLAAVGILPAQASPTDTLQVYHIIEDVVLERADGTWALQMRGFQPDGCSLPVEITQNMDEHWLIFEVYRHLPADLICTEVLVAYEATVPLEEEIATWLEEHLAGDNSGTAGGGLTTPEALIVEVNNFIGIVRFDEQDLPNVLRVSPIERDPMIVEQVTVVTDGNAIDDTDSDRLIDGAIRLEIEGYHPDGCRQPFRTQMRIVRDEIYVQVYRTEPESEVCPAVMLMFTTLIEIDDPLPAGTYTYHVNEVKGKFTIEGDPQAQAADESRSLHMIESADAIVLESFPPQIQLRVQGYIPDGCQTETLVDVRIQDRIIEVTIYREIPPFVMCPMMIVPYEDVIRLDDLRIADLSSYRILVNGVEAGPTAP